jgi:hypothetical protein
MVYFEQTDSWGGCYPKSRNNIVRLKIRVGDVFGKVHAAKLAVPLVTLGEARKFNPDFGRTLAELRGECLPYDAMRIPEHTDSGGGDGIQTASVVICPDAGVL